jgi:hypothetical protein
MRRQSTGGDLPAIDVSVLRWCVHDDGTTEFEVCTTIGQQSWTTLRRFSEFDRMLHDVRLLMDPLTGTASEIIQHS